MVIPWDAMVVIYVNSDGHLDCAIGYPEDFNTVVAFDIHDEHKATNFVEIAKKLQPRERDWYLLLAIATDSYTDAVDAYRFGLEVIPAWCESLEK